MVTSFSALIMLASARLMTAFAAATTDSRSAAAIGQKPRPTMGIELDPAAGKSLRVDNAGQHRGVGDRRIFAAAAVAGGPGIGARALRADFDTAGLVESHDRPASGADFDNVDDGHLQRIARIDPAPFQLVIRRNTGRPLRTSEHFAVVPPTSR